MTDIWLNFLNIIEKNYSQLWEDTEIYTVMQLFKIT
jgi:hypothetical protein